MKKMKIYFFLFSGLMLYQGAAFSTNISLESAPVWGVRKRITETALEYLGTPYVYAGISSEGVDCSGLVYCVYRDVYEKKLPRRVEDLIEAGDEVIDTPMSGDLVFFDTTGGPSHVGIYLGDSQFVHAASEGPRTGVIISSLDEDYYRTRYLGARQYVEESLPLIRIDVDRQPAERRITETFHPGVPIRFSIRDVLAIPRSLIFNVFQNDQFILSKRIKSGPGSDPSLVLIIPSQGEWTVSLEDQNSSKLLVLRFMSGGLQ